MYPIQDSLELYPPSYPHDYILTIIDNIMQNPKKSAHRMQEAYRRTKPRQLGKLSQADFSWLWLHQVGTGAFSDEEKFIVILQSPGGRTAKLLHIMFLKCNS